MKIHKYYIRDLYAQIEIQSFHLHLHTIHTFYVKLCCNIIIKKY